MLGAALPVHLDAQPGLSVGLDLSSEQLLRCSVL
jgi:hypothetical protein